MLIAFAALLAIAQAGDPPAPPEVLQAGQALSTCILGRLEQAAETVPAETITDALLAHCRPQLDAAVAAHGRWVDSSALSDTEKAAARAAMRQSIDGLRAEIIGAIRQRRAG